MGWSPPSASAPPDFGSDFVEERSDELPAAAALRGRDLRRKNGRSLGAAVLRGFCGARSAPGPAWGLSPPAPPTQPLNWQPTSQDMMARMMWDFMQKMANDGGSVGDSVAGAGKNNPASAQDEEQAFGGTGARDP